VDYTFQISKELAGIIVIVEPETVTAWQRKGLSF